MSIPLRFALFGLLLAAFGTLPACDDDDPTDPGPLDEADVLHDVSAGDTGRPDATPDPDVSGETSDTGPDVEPECSEDDDCDPLAVDECQAVRCVGGECVIGGATDGTTCDDEDPCNVGEACEAGVCAGGAPLDCDDENPCTDDGCNAVAGCTHSNNSASCDDGEECTSVDKCFGGQCLGSGNTCPEECTNDQDDNGDDLVDCQDPKCVEAPNCDPECTIVDTATCGDAIIGDIEAGETDLIDTWACLPGDTLDGPERGWQIAVAEASTVTVALPEDAPAGATLFHLTDPAGAGCKPDACESGGEEVTFDAAPGETHYVVLDAPDGTSGEVSLGVACELCEPQCAGKQCGADGCGGVCGTCTAGSVCADTVCKVPPANDQCGGALFVTGSLPFLASGSTTGANDDYGLLPDSGCPGSNDFGFGQGAPDTTWRFTPTTTGDYLIQVDAAFDSVLYVVTDCADLEATCVGAANIAGGSADQVIASLSMGVTYRIVVDGFIGGQSGDFVLTVNHWPCTGSCAGKSCGPDGCGGGCGVCTGLEACTPAGQCTAPAPNETCGSATTITTVPYSAQQATTAAEDDHITLPEVCSGGPVSGISGQEAGDVVYELIAPAAGKYRATISPQGAFNPILTVLEACPGTQQDCIGASDEASGDEVVELVLGQGESAWLVVDGSEPGDAGVFDLEVEQIPCTPACDGKQCGPNGCGGTCGTCGPGTSCTASAQCIDVPANDACGGAEVIESLPYSDGGSTLGASNSYQVGPGKCQGGPASANYGTGPDVVYRYTAPVAQSLRFSFDTSLTDFITYLYALKSCGTINTSTCQASAVSADFGGSILVVNLQAGETLFVVVDGWSGNNSGTYFFKAEVFSP